MHCHQLLAATLFTRARGPRTAIPDMTVEFKPVNSTRREKRIWWPGRVDVIAWPSVSMTSAPAVHLLACELRDYKPDGYSQYKCGACVWTLSRSGMAARASPAASLAEEECAEASRPP